MHRVTAVAWDVFRLAKRQERLRAIMMDGFVLAMDHIMTRQEEFEKVLRLQTWKFLNMNLLMLIQLKLDNYYE